MSDAPPPQFRACHGWHSSLGQSGHRILMVGEDPAAVEWLKRRVAEVGGHLEQVPDAASACRCLHCTHWDVVAPIVDEGSEGTQALQWWADALRDFKSPPRLMPLSRNPSVALQAASLGIPQVHSEEQFTRAISQFNGREAEAVIPLPAVRPVTVGSSQLVADSPAMLQVCRTIIRVAPSSATVLLTGESGTGKELAARTVHQHSSRAQGPFVVVNCAAIPADLLESELFGHERGSFTGAVSRQIGRWERAQGGTLFLDEIGDLHLHLQGKILRAIQEREIERVGSAQPIPVDVRIIAATNRDLRQETAQGRFREDLYYRLAVVSIHLPRLVDRSDDLLLLTSHYLSRFAQANGKQVRGMTAQALTRLRQHSWPGNIRELQNVLEAAVLHMTGDTLQQEHLPAYLQHSETVELVPPAEQPASFLTLSELEARYIGQVLRDSRGRLATAARILGIHRNTLRRKIQEYRLA